MILLCPLCASANKTTYLQTEDERMFHFLEKHEPYELAFAYNDLLSICERKHMMKTREISK